MILGKYISQLACLPNLGNSQTQTDLSQINPLDFVPQGRFRCISTTGTTGWVKQEKHEIFSPPYTKGKFRQTI